MTKIFTFVEVFFRFFLCGMIKIENMVYKQRWFMEVVKENTQRIGVTEEDGRDRVR